MRAAAKSTIRAYNNSKDLFLQLKELFIDLEGSTGSEKSNIIKDIKYSLDDLKSEYKKIKTDILIDQLDDPNQANDLQNNLDVLRHSADKMEKQLMAIEYYDNILPNINKYILGVINTLSIDEISKYGDDPVKLKKIFLAKILSPKKILQFKRKLDQLVQSTLSQKMFNAIFKGLLYNKTIKNTKLSSKEFGEQFGHPEVHKRAVLGYKHFQSLKDYKKQKEQEQSIPIMITNQMRADLSNLGYTKEEISKLKPEEANDIINKSAQSSSRANVKFRRK